MTWLAPKSHSSKTSRTSGSALSSASIPTMMTAALIVARPEEAEEAAAAAAAELKMRKVAVAPLPAKVATGNLVAEVVVARKSAANPRVGWRCGLSKSQT